MFSYYGHQRESYDYADDHTVAPGQFSNESFIYHSDIAPFLACVHNGAVSE